MLTVISATLVVVGVVAGYTIILRHSDRRSLSEEDGPTCRYCRSVHPPYDELKGEPEVVSLRRARCRLRARVEELEGEVRDLRAALAAAEGGEQRAPKR